MPGLEKIRRWKNFGVEFYRELFQGGKLMLKKGILLSAILLVLVMSASVAEARRGIVVPTAWGYGVVNSGISYPWPAYGYLGMYPAVPVPSAQIPAPAWNGFNWSYYNGAYGNPGYAAGYPAYQNSYTPMNTVAAVACNLNVRSEPYVAGKKKRNSNVVGSLNTGEQVYILGRYGNWFFIQSAYHPVRRGYVYGSYLRFYQNNWPTSNYTAFYPSQFHARSW